MIVSFSSTTRTIQNGGIGRDRSQRSLHSAATLKRRGSHVASSPGEQGVQEQANSALDSSSDDPRSLIEANRDSYFRGLFSKHKWKGSSLGKSWCKLFQGKYFCAPLTVETIEADDTLRVPSMEIWDITDLQREERRESLTTSNLETGFADTMMVTHSIMLSRRVKTRPVDITRFETYSTLQIGRRYYICRDEGPLPASKAFASTINQVYKRNNQPWELMVPAGILLELFQEFMLINNSGGCASFAVSKTNSPGWFAVQHMVIVGPEEEVMVPLQLVIQRGEKDATFGEEFRYKLHVGANRDGDMFGLHETRPIVLSDVTHTKPVPWNAIPDVDATDKDFAIPVQTTGYLIDLEAGIVRKIDTNHVERIPRPLYGWRYETSAPRRSGCSSISRVSKAEDDGESNCSPSNPLAILGATVIIKDEAIASYARLLSNFFAEFNEAMEASQRLRVHLKETPEVHDAGRKGSFTIYEMNPVVKISGEWYWLKSLKLARVFPRYKLSEERHRYLAMASDDNQDTT